MKKVYVQPFLRNAIKKGRVRGITNFDRIKVMSVEELAELMQHCGWDYPPYCSYLKIQECDQNCLKCAKKWLESEVKE